MEITQIIRRPVLTEKSNNLQQSNVYTFEVDWLANKFQIKKAIEFIFQVKVVKVNTLKVDKKPKRLGRFNGFQNRYKKVMVTLKDGDLINFYPDEKEKEEKEKAKKELKASKAKEEKAQASEKEAKLAEKIAAKKAQASKTKKTSQKEEKEK